MNAGDPAPSAPPDDRPPSVTAIGPNENLLHLLYRGEIDALFAPFAPAALYLPEAPLRTLLPDPVAAEADWAMRKGFVPGLHVIALRREVAEARPEIAQFLPDLLDSARAAWRGRRRRYAETTPWISQAFLEETRRLPEGWDRSGVEPNRSMTAEFLRLLLEQDLIRNPLTPEDLFPAHLLPCRTRIDA
ncbi:hypothetical protein [Aureimonas populi]|uniref:ABC transporter substrate-binding protein n=1 Tax=Aureimonas populi TaxID=1701758 RepID=A0ABW5CK00_9HYPH|nr:hypothetical protein [Aureimonas populi]